MFNETFEMWLKRWTKRTCLVLILLAVYVAGYKHGHHTQPPAPDAVTVEGCEILGEIGAMRFKLHQITEVQQAILQRRTTATFAQQVEIVE